MDKGREMRFFDAFAGVGGFHVGIRNAFNNRPHIRNGSEVLRRNSTDTSEREVRFVGYSEIDKYASSVYERHFKGVPAYGDITKINAKELPDFDCLVGGFPCQAFSIAGKRRGFEDTRGTLFFDLARILREKQPMYGVFENVKGLISHNQGTTLDTILETLQSIGYYCNWEIYNSKDFGVPQNRERIYLVCQNYTGLTSVGSNTRMTSSEKLIQSYLFQLLLNNLAEVKNLQEAESKDSVLGYLIWKEINQSLESVHGESTTDGTTERTEESTYPLPDADHWQSIAIWLSNEWGVDLSEPNKSTISTAIKKITHSTTYTYSQMQQLIWLATVVLRQSQKSLWSEVLSDLTVIQEGTKYARINHKTEEAIVTESGTVHLSHVYKDQHDKFIKRHLRGTPRPQVFPIAGTDTADTFIRTIRTGGAASYTEKHARDIIRIREATKRGYAEAKPGDAINLTTPNSKTRRGRVSDVAPTLDTGMQIHTLVDDTYGTGLREYKDTAPTLRSNRYGLKVSDDVRIRRLTPVECERLQGFEDNWTAEGTDGPISDTQRYKMCGNAVSVPVVEAVFERLLNG